MIFDTSGLNGLTDDPDSQSLIKSLGIGFGVRLSETSLSELSATPTPARREQLLSVCRHLVHAGECIRPYNWILEELTQMHARNPDHFDWKELNIRGPELDFVQLKRREGEMI